MPSAALHLDPVMQALCVLGGDTDYTSPEPAVHPCPEPQARSVRLHGHLGAAVDAAGARVLVGELDLRERALELKLLDPLDRGSAEERAVADDREALAPVLGRECLR